MAQLRHVGATGIRARPRLPPAWILVAGGSFVGYFSLLMYCDLSRPVNPGFEADPVGGAVVVTEVQSSTPASEAGIARGDRLIAVNGVTVVDSDAWGGLSGIYELGVPMPVIVERGAARVALTLVLPSESADYWLSRTGLTLLLFRVAQIVALAAGLVIAWRRPRDPVALSAAWFLLTCTVFVIALPYRLFTVWRDQPIGIRELLWIPYASGLVIGPILLTFVTLFPRPIPYARFIQGLTWTVACAAAAAPLSNAAHLLYWGTELRTVGPRSLPLLVGTSVSLLAAVTLALVHYRQVRDVTERRRLRVVVAGIVVAALPGYWAIVYRWLPSHTDQSESVFASPIMAVAAVALLAAPLSLTYAVLRHRLFDVSFIVRTALQYTLARWTVLSLVPAISLFMILETLRLRNLTVNAVLARRGGLFLLLTAIAFVVFAYRRRWLRAIDRRFFRERHYAYSVLREVAVEVGRAGSLDSAAPLVVARIEAAMHPEFVALLVRDLPSRTFKTTAATPSGSAPPDLPEDSKLVAMAFVHSHPLNTSEDGDEAVLRDLSPSDLTYVRGAHIEVVIRVASQDEHPHALLVLGPKRSEEPYANEDYGVLVTIAENLALLVGRVAPQRESPSLEECPECGTCFDGGTRVCRSHDRPLSRRSLPRRLADRYRLDRRIAAGGMGTVYEAFDTALEKPVAAKVVHENLASTDGILSRFNEEAKIAASLRGHPNVVTVYDYGLVDGHQPFIIMELLDGLTLRHLLQATRTLDPGRALDILSGVCSAVSAAHHLGLIHRDLKPENIFLTEVHGDAIPKVIDFGIARPLAFVTTATYRRHTDPNSLVGTLEYMSPEQYRCEAVSHAWDLWSLAVIALEMLSGRPPATSFLPSVGAWEPGASLKDSLPECVDLFNGALALDPAQRPTDVAAFLHLFTSNHQLMSRRRRGARSEAKSRGRLYDRLRMRR